MQTHQTLTPAHGRALVLFSEVRSHAAAATAMQTVRLFHDITAEDCRSPRWRCTASL